VFNSTGSNFAIAVTLFSKDGSRGHTVHDRAAAPVLAGSVGNFIMAIPTIQDDSRVAPVVSASRRKIDRGLNASVTQ